MRIVLIAAFATFFAIGGYPADPCDANWSALIGPYDHPETATDTEWSISKQIASRLMRDCPTGPTNKESRRLFFEFAERQLSLDYARLTTAWEEQGHPLSEGGEESIWEFERELRQFISSIADPKRDAEHCGSLLMKPTSRSVKNAIWADYFFISFQSLRRLTSNRQSSR
jgi:hypothetical protein